MSTITEYETFTIQFEETDTPQTLGKEFKEDIQRINIQYNEDDIWGSKSRGDIYITDMQDQHIINALKMCKRNVADLTNQCIPIQYQGLLLHAIKRKLIDKTAGEWDTEENSL